MRGHLVSLCAQFRSSSSGKSKENLQGWPGISYVPFIMEPSTSRSCSWTFYITCNRPIFVKCYLKTRRAKEADDVSFQILTERNSRSYKHFIIVTSCSSARNGDALIDFYLKVLQQGRWKSIWGRRFWQLNFHLSRIQTSGLLFLMKLSQQVPKLSLRKRVWLECFLGCTFTGTEVKKFNKNTLKPTSPCPDW